MSSPESSEQNNGVVPPDASTPGGLPRGLKLPPKRNPAQLKLPPKRDVPKVGIEAGKTCKCPYCGAVFPWPPEKLACPSCKSTLRPPPGFAPSDIQERRIAKEKIVQAHDMAVRALGPTPDAKQINRSGLIISLAILFVVGFILMLASFRAPAKRKKFDPMEWTVARMQLYAMALEHFKTDCGRYPKYDELNLVALVSDMGVPGWNGPYLNKLRVSDHADGWKTPWYFTVTNDVPVLQSAGPDRTFFTEDDLVAPREWFHCHPDFVPRSPTDKPVAHEFSVKIGTAAAE